MIVTTIDENGFFLCNYKLGQEPEGSIIAPVVYDGGLIIAKLVDGVFVEFATPEELASIIEMPNTITAVQLFSQLLLLNISEVQILEKIEFLVENNIITNIEGELAKVAIAKATIFERNHPFVSLIGSSFSIDINSVFINASKL